MIEVSDLCKSFIMPAERHFSLRNRILACFKRQELRLLRVLKGVSFSVDSGECVGLVGCNGCGKSTLLKLLAGIIVPNSGTIDVSGPISPFLELGVGFNLELTVRDNVFLYGSVLGFTEREIKEKYQSIIAFAELEDFQESKLKTLSSGMQVRAAFAVASHVDKDIYLADEVLAVGDARFQEKCFDVFENLRKSGKTIIYVSHDLQSVERFCDRAIWLNGGEIVADGHPAEVTEQYLNFMQVDQSARRAIVNFDRVFRLPQEEKSNKERVRIHYTVRARRHTTKGHADCELDPAPDDAPISAPNEETTEEISAGT